jgi:hypothetical protein
MLYFIPDTLWKVSINTNKTGYHVTPDTLLKVSLNTNKTLVFIDTFHNVSGIKYNMVTSFIGVYRHLQQCVRYKV